MNYLYDLIIRPIEYIIETVFDVFYGKLDSAGYAIIAVSMAVSLLTLPLYNRAEAIQRDERNRQKQIGRWTQHIKSAFRGDERYMMLSAYYRIARYKPIYALRSTLTLLLQIPFFIAAYRFLSHLELLRGRGFFFVNNLGAPDASLRIGMQTINVLPILMTTVNILSAVVYLRDYGKREKIQLLLTALVFLFLLYNSPSGLVLYWTCNNLFSLCKNVVTYVVRHQNRESGINKKTNEKTYNADKGDTIISVLSLSILALLSTTITSAIIASDPSAFIENAFHQRPEMIIIRIALISVGMYIIWGGTVYFFSKGIIRRFFSPVIWSVSLVAIVDYMSVKDSKDFGTLSTLMTFSREPFYGDTELLFNLLVIGLVVLICVCLYKKARNAIVSISIITLLSLSLLCVYHIHKVYSKTNRMLSYTLSSDESELYGRIPLSKDSKNVIVLMLDRAVSGVVPFIFAEKEELREQFDGFTFYPNTISYARITTMGSPAVYGGYEYTPVEINKRKSERLVDKHNEALKVMPVMFSEQGFHSIVCDPSYANYSDIPDLSIYSDYEDIRTYNLGGGVSE